ncbi:unnamed protein product [Onchocerca flexuosa]|uniref:PHD domain-containing protein n=1 Tax=Onchocerca flexuosa TaxID=387005 RepID=A0A183H8D2_9BILA|nr:unnamed protein product [Onchocerca flexuosa]
MSQLPVGYYLCVRCLRSRRPFAEDVKNLCGNAVPSLERMLVEIALKHAELAYKEALDAIGKLPPDGISLDSELCKRHVCLENFSVSQNLWIRIDIARIKIIGSPTFVDESLIAVFCNEILNSEAWKLIIDTLIRVKPPTEKDKEIYEQIKQRSVSAQVPSVLFPDSSSGKRRRGLKRGLSGYGKFIAGHRKRSKNHFHQEQDACSATTCLHPYSDQIRWIQCEAGCSRWYHYVCVGQTVNRVDQTSMYYCHSCLTEGKIPPACSSSGSPTSCSL